MKVATIVGIITIVSFVGAVGAKGYQHFAKESEFREFVAGYQFDKDKENYFFFDKKVANCINEYGENFENATPEQREDCLWFRGERDILKDKFKIKRG